MGQNLRRTVKKGETVTKEEQGILQEDQASTTPSPSVGVEVCGGQNPVLQEVEQTTLTT